MDIATFRHRALLLAGLGALAALLALATWLAVARIYQVDEAQNLYMARVAATGQADRFFTTAQLWLLGPMGWIARGAPDSATAFLWARLLFLGLFLANTVLLAACTGVPLRSGAGLAALLGAATLAPLWDYGFEVRHDNLILLGLLVTWHQTRVRPAGRAGFALAGAVAIALLASSLKAVVYVLPLSAALLLWPSPDHPAPRRSLRLAWVSGAAVAAAGVALVYGLLGLGSVALDGLRGGVQASGEMRVAAWPALARVPRQAPLLVAALAAVAAGLAVQVARRGRQALGWDGPAPELALTAGALAALLANPVPYPYNLVNLVPFAFLAVARALLGLDPARFRAPAFAVPAALAVLLGHAAPFAVATARHLEWTNDRQVRLIAAAEALTGPDDPVYDATGLLLTRPRVHFLWFLHTLNVRAFTDGSLPPVRRILTDRPAPVLIRSYRTDWLPREDQDFFRSRYVPVSDELWVLGVRLPPGGGSFEILHPGRYRVVERRGGSASPAASGALDGRALEPGVAHLAAGKHSIALPGSDEAILAWVGPRLELPPALQPGDHRRLFVNWY